MTIEYLEQKLVRRPFSPLFARLVHEYLKVGRNQEAKKICFSGLENYPQYITAHFALAECYISEQDYNAAIQSIDTAISLNPNTETLRTLQSEVQEIITSLSIPDSINTNSLNEYKLINSEESITSVPAIETEIPIESTDQNAITQKENITNDESKLELIEAKPEIDQPVVPDEKSIGKDDSRIVSRTLAEIYASQGEHMEAIATYQILKRNRPDLKEEIEKRILELEGYIQDKLSQRPN